jgi:hypothetical protein
LNPSSCIEIVGGGCVGSIVYTGDNDEGVGIDLSGDIDGI